MRWLLVPLLFLALAPTAHAGWEHDRGREIANRVWHNPCGGEWTLSFGKPQTAPPDAWWYAWAIPSRCEMWLDELYETNVDAGGICTLMLHEAGHLAGVGHSTNPRSVMYAYWQGRVDPRCRVKRAARR